MAERIWTPFWKPKGTPLVEIRRGLEKILDNADGVPFALVAECDGAVCGKALVIEDDFAGRPALAPWLAALGVDEPMRRQGIAAALLDEAARRTAALGLANLYLNSLPHLQGFYTRLGWTIIEEHVGPSDLTIYQRKLTA